MRDVVARIGTSGRKPETSTADPMRARIIVARAAINALGLVKRLLDDHGWGPQDMSHMFVAVVSVRDGVPPHPDLPRVA